MSEHNCSDHRGAFSLQLGACACTFRGDIMPDINPPLRGLTLDPAEVIAVNEAYDMACRTLQNIGQLEVDREIIARRILQAAETGERNANKLCERAIHGLTAFDYRQHRT
jgi:hypothetical protein